MSDVPVIDIDDYRGPDAADDDTDEQDADTDADEDTTADSPDRPWDVTQWDDDDA